MIILLFAIKTSVMYGNFSDEKVAGTSEYDRLVSSADYLVNYGLVKKESGKYYPNWIISVDDAEVKKIGDASGLDLQVFLDSTDGANGINSDYGTCIYRLIIYGEKKNIEKIYFCTNGADDANGNGASG
jgi:hypothetical protein